MSARVKQYCLCFVATVFVAAAARSATVVVTNTNDTGGGSLRAAIQFASSGDTIVFQIPTSDPAYDPATRLFTITISSTDEIRSAFVISKSLTIDGAGSRIVVRRNNAPGAPDLRFFKLNGGNVVLAHLTLYQGEMRSSGFGGAIYNQGGLTIRNCTFVENFSFSFGGAVFNAAGASATIENCTFLGNGVIEGGGGGAIFNADTATLAVKSCTIVQNAVEGQGGGIRNYGGASIFNTILVGNQADTDKPQDVQGNCTSLGYNLIGDADAFSVASGDHTGVTPAALNLLPLQNNGGSTDTLVPGPASIAVDQGKSNGPGAIDQRDFARPVDRDENNAFGGDGSDIGAVEVGIRQTGPNYTVTTTDERTGLCMSNDCTLVTALGVANGNIDASTINFAPNVEGTITTNLTPNGLSINTPVTINGPGAKKVAVTGSNTNRVFSVSGQNAVISGLRIIFGKVDAGNGAGILHTGVHLTVKDCVFGGNVAANSSGGGIYNTGGSTLVLEGCTFVVNQAGQFGGGAFNDGTFSATNCTFSSNIALRGGGLISRFNGGVSSATLRNCTISENTATSTSAGTGDGGGGYYAEGGAQQHHLGNCIIAGNTNSVNPDVRGQITSDGHNFIGNVANALGFTNGVNGDQVGVPGATKNPQLSAIDDHGGPTPTYALLGASNAINAGDDNLAPPADQRHYGRNGVSDIGAFELNGFLPSTLANISTRLRVETGNNILIGGFIITGTQPKKVVIRAVGPSLPFAGILANPRLELYQGSTLLASNDDWQNQPAADRQAVIDSTVPPGNDLESALVRTLPANGTAYTAIVRGVNDGTGIGVVEAFDLDRTVDSKLANISTRGLVQTGNNVLIAGTIVLGTQSQKVIVRAIGPSLPLAGTLANPTLELRDQNGDLVEANDDWVSSPNKQAIIDSTVSPPNDLESAIVRTLTPAAYTAVVRGVNDTTGIAVVEVFALQ